MEKEILDFIFQSGGIGLQFYNPEEYNNEGIVYTIIDSDEKYIDLQWEKGDNYDYGSLVWYGFLRHLNSGFYVIKNTDFLYSAMGVGLDIDDVFGSLNEGTYQPILNLRFDPPLRNEWELLEVMKVIQRNYDDVTWRSGGIPTNLPYLDQIWEDPSEGIWYITIGFFKSSPKNITYTSGHIDDPSFSDEEHHMYKHLNGREWVRSHDFDADETSDMFGPLIETNEFDWVGDIIDDDANRFSKIPSYNHERYILRFSQPMLASDVMDLLKFLKEIGWDVGDNIVRDYNFDDLVEYSSNGTGYIHLRPNGKVTYADDVKLFSDYTDIKLDTVRQIWV